MTGTPSHLRLPGRINRANAATALAVAAEFGVRPSDAVPHLAQVASVAGRYATVQQGDRTIRLLLAKNPAGWLEAFDMAEHVPTLLSINARDPDGLDTSWLYDVDFSPLRGRRVLITGDRAMDLAVRLEVNEIRFEHVPSFGRALRVDPDRVGSRSSPTTPPSRTSERSWTVSTDGRHRAPHDGSTESALRIVWIYPDLLSTYGDRGNMLILAQRAHLRGLPVETIEVRADQSLPEQGDIYLLAGGEDGPQALAAQRLLADRGLHRALARGAALLAVCAGYQLVGTSFFAKGAQFAGLELVDLSSDRGPSRAVGELAGTPDPALGLPTVTGFENHGGRTHLGPGVAPLARVTARHRQRRRDRGRLAGPHPRDLHARPGARPQPCDRRPAAQPGRPGPQWSPLDDAWPAGYAPNASPPCAPESTAVSARSPRPGWRSRLWMVPSGRTSPSAPGRHRRGPCCTR